MKPLHEIWFDIDTFVLDIDGVLTDGSLIIAENNFYRTMNAKDGYALQLAIKKGYHVIIISGAKNELAKTRLQNLGIKYIYTAIENKLEKLNEVIRELNLYTNKIAFMGDDMPDIEVMKTIALPCCPADACDDVQIVSKYISNKNGGQGAVRDIIEKTMKAQDTWE